MKVQEGGGRIELPNAKVVLTYSVNDMGQTKLESSLPPLSVIVQLFGAMVGVADQYVQALINKGFEDRGGIIKQ